MPGSFDALLKRVVVAVIAIPLIVWVTLQGGYFFFLFVALISSLALFEFYGLARKKGMLPLVGLGLAAGFLVNGSFVYERAQIEIYGFLSERGMHLQMFSQLQLLVVVLLVFVLLVLVVELFRAQGSFFQNVGATFSGVVVVSFCFGFLIGLREVFPYGFPVHKFMATSFASEDQLVQINRWGGFTVLAVFVSIWTCDTAAYFAGTRIGRHKLFPRVSPGKTWEGAVAGFVAAVITMVLFRQMWLEYLRVVDAFIIGVLIGVFGQIGDLVESRFKRDAGVKDSSSIIPGHGGVYDRFDSLVFVAPIVYLYIDFIVLS